MDSNMVFWFQGFEKGIAALEQIEREKLFRACGKNCVQQGTLLPFIRSSIRRPVGMYIAFLQL